MSSNTAHDAGCACSSFNQWGAPAPQNDALGMSGVPPPLGALKRGGGTMVPMSGGGVAPILAWLGLPELGFERAPVQTALFDTTSIKSCRRHPIFVQIRAF